MKMPATLSATMLLVATVTATPGQQRRDGQVVAPGAGSISGVVVLSDVSAAPVRRATVDLTGTSLSVERLVALTDDAGGFAFPGLPPGRYQVSASKTGYLPSAFGAMRPLGEGTPVVVAAGQQVGGLNIELPRGAVITGSVFDERSRPLANLTVRALRYAISPDTGDLLPEIIRIGSAEATSDDTGRFRLYGLAPGEYVVSAAPLKREFDGPVREITDADIQWAQLLLRAPAGSAATLLDHRGRPAPTLRPIGSAPVFHHSGESIANATRITVRVAEERPGADVLMRVVRTASVSGTVSGAGPMMRAGGTVTLVDESSAFEATARWQQGDNSFRFAGVPPGRYALVAAAEGQPARGRAEVFVDAQDVRTFISLQPAATLSGRVVFEGGAIDDATMARVSLVGSGRSNSGSRAAVVGADGTFAFTAVPPGTYQLVASMLPGLQPGWRVKSAARGDTELLDAPVTVGPAENIADVVVSLVRSRSEISGMLLEADGKPSTRYTIVVFSADPLLRGANARRTMVVRPATDGRFLARDLPAGDYLISAVTDLEPGQWRNREFLAELAEFAVKVALAEGEKKVQNIKLGGGS